MILEYRGKRPKIPRTAFVAEGACIIGDVRMGENSSAWFNAVIRGDFEAIRIGRNTNIQDGCVLHADKGSPLIVGDNVTIGHGAIVHGCRIASNCLIGMGAIIMNGAEIGEWSIVGSGSVVTEGKRVHPRTLMLGVPAEPIREASAGDLGLISSRARDYVKYAGGYLSQGRKGGGPKL